MAELAKLAGEDVLAERFLVEKQNLKRSMEALKDAARHDVDELRDRAKSVVERPKQFVFEQRHALMIGAFAAGLYFGIRKHFTRR